MPHYYQYCITQGLPCSAMSGGDPPVRGIMQAHAANILTRYNLTTAHGSGFDILSDEKKQHHDRLGTTAPTPASCSLSRRIVRPKSRSPKDTKLAVHSVFAAPLEMTYLAVPIEFNTNVRRQLCYFPAQLQGPKPISCVLDSWSAR